MTPGGSVYEKWVRALRAWADDPASLPAEMPVLTEQSFPPSAYERFLAHLNSALTVAMARWSSEFTAQWGRATNEHDRERAMVQMRAKLARRLQLAAHPSLPTIVREPLWEGAAADIRNLQQEIEKNLLKSTENASSDRSARERLLKTARANALTAILAPDFPLHTLFQSHPATQPSERRVAVGGESSLGVHGPCADAPRRRLVVVEHNTIEGSRSNAQ